MFCSSIECVHNLHYIRAQNSPRFSDALQCLVSLPMLFISQSKICAWFIFLRASDIPAYLTERLQITVVFHNQNSCLSFFVCLFHTRFSFFYYVLLHFHYNSCVRSFFLRNYILVGSNILIGNNFLDLKNAPHYTQKHLQGWVQFPTGGKVRESLCFDLVQFQNRQYSLDGRR